MGQRQRLGLRFSVPPSRESYSGSEGLGYFPHNARTLFQPRCQCISVKSPWNNPGHAARRIVRKGLVNRIPEIPPLGRTKLFIEELCLNTKSCPSIRVPNDSLQSHVAASTISPNRHALGAKLPREKAKTQFPHIPPKCTRFHPLQSNNGIEAQSGLGLNVSSVGNAMVIVLFPTKQSKIRDRKSFIKIAR